MKLPPRRPLVIASLAALAAAGLLALVVAISGLNALRRFDADVMTRLAEHSVPSPAWVFARPLVLRAGMRPSRVDLAGHLERAGYRRAATAAEVRRGEFAEEPSRFTIGRRGFRWADGWNSGGTATLELARRGRIEKIFGAEGREQEKLYIEPPVIGSLHGEDPRRREPVALDDLPEHLPEAFLAIEDRRFFEHRGIDPRRIAGAFLANLRAGGIVQGGSTITQQLVKNLLLGNERVLSRKIEEATIALLLERRRTKPEILEAYLNEIYLGQQGPVAIHGVAAASRHYFGKQVGDLASWESALLAGLARGPSRYSPLRDPAAAQGRRDLVLRAMFEEGYLEEDAYQLALAADLGLRPPALRVSSTRFFVDRVREELDERHAPELLEESGLRIFTTLDWRYQRLGEKALRAGLAELEETYSWLRARDPPLEGALLALDPKTGDVLAMVGGRDYGRSQFNRAIQAQRQPGSVFKAVVALAALAPPEPAFTLASVLDDEPLVVPAPEPEPGEEQEEDWIPFNHDEEFRGEVTLRQALEESLNIPMVRLGQDVGLRQVIRTARKLGIRSRLRPVPSLSLGTFEVSLLEITRAYAVLADEGRRTTPRTLFRVESAEGEKLEENPPRSERVFSRQEVYLVTSALEGAVKRGTGRRVRALGYAGPLAGKTGSSDEYRDGWFIGYTPEIVVGVWVGFDDETTTRRPGAFTALPIFTAFMKSALGARGGEGFEPPPGVESVSVVASAEHRAGLRCDGESEWFLQGTAPTESCGSFWRRLPAVGSGPDEEPWWHRLAPNP